MTTKLDHEVADLKRRLDDALAERDEAEAQKTAMAEVLEVINSSRGDLKPVFDAMLERAMRLCDAAFGGLGIWHDDCFEWIADRGLPLPFAEYIAHNEVSVGSRSGFARVARDDGHVQFSDISASSFYKADEPYTRAIVDLGGARTTLSVPLVKDGGVIGVFGFFRQEVRPFAEKQIALVKSFAAQAVIAMENARLITETRESLEYQTATSDVLKVISRSTFDLQPVLQTVVETATRLCGADMGFLLRREGDEYRTGAAVGYTREYEQFMQTHPLAADRGSITGRVALEGKTVHIADVTADPEYTLSESATLAGQRTALGVPLLRAGQPMGVIVLARKRVEPFTEKQIELVTTFADQAVIAIENTRLITDTHEALEQQTATAEVLGVINSSPGDLVPVFNAMLEKATRLCAASFGILLTYDGQRFRHAALRGIPPAYAEFMRQHPPIYGPDSAPGRLLAGENLIHVLDMTDTELYRSGEPNRMAIADLAGARTVVAVPLRKDDVLMGAIVVFRQEIRAFSEKQLSLLRNFAAQAVIAMENARLITETHEALEQQTATAEVLQVINSALGNLAPVFDALLEKAARLCGADFGGLFVYDGQHLRTTAILGATEAYAGFLSSNPVQVTPRNMHGRLMSGEPFIHIPDVSVAAPYITGDPMQRAFVDPGRGRTVLGVPLWKDKIFLGELAVYRCEVRPFSEKQIALLQNFAAQAVIAMENARLINETREALEQQTATAEVLQVINSSPGDLAPVFEAMIERAMRLCEASFGIMFAVDGDHARIVAMRNVPELLIEYLVLHPPEIGPDTLFGRAVRQRTLLHTPDALASGPYRAGVPLAVKTAELGNARALLMAPLIKDETVIGVFAIFRKEARAFSEKQLALLENFAAQAVIAIENARLLGELRERTGDLQQSLEYQTATTDVLKVISRSTFDLKTIFEAVVGSAIRLCHADNAGIYLDDDGGAYRRTVGVAVKSPEYDDIEANVRIAPGAGTVVGRAALEGRTVHIEDAWTDPLYEPKEDARIGGVHTMLGVPLLREGTPIGVLALARERVKPFSNPEVQLVTTFADQAVIAIENARLIAETREALEQQTATAEVLQVINASPGDLTPVFNAILEKANSLCETSFGVLWTFDGTNYLPDAVQGPQAFIDAIKDKPRPPANGGTLYRHAAGEQVVHIEDMAAERQVYGINSTRRVFVDLGGGRSALSVALRKDGTLFGALQVYRQEVRAFSEKQIALLQNFAAQAVIAMENARLITETREALDQQTATAEVLQVINASPGDLTPVFDAMLDKATALCEANLGMLYRFEEHSIHLLAVRGASAEAMAHFRQPVNIEPESVIGGMARGEAEIAHVPDIVDTEVYRSGVPSRVKLVELTGARTALWVALRKDTALLGVFIIYRREVRPFSDRQIALLQNFAAQAVIAMENARLLNETREALEQQTATAEVLQVINASPGDLTPVFDAMLEKACRLCEAAYGMLYSYEDNTYRTMAVHNLPPAYAKSLEGAIVAGKRNALGRLASGERIVHITDLRDDEAYRSRDPIRVASVELGGARTYVVVPLLKDDVMVGAIAAYRQEVRRFSDKQIALLENFAAQAVIAIENARLLDEIRQRQAELRVTFDNMGDGVVMFDEHLRLAAWNRNFQEMLDLPDSMLAQRPSYADYLRLLAQRGEFGTVDVEAELGRRLEHMDQEYRSERTRPDGRVIEVRRNAVPDGGFVLIYSDITDRKRSEAEIRAARDAAQAAYEDLKFAQASLIQAQKMAALGQLTAGIAHEIKNPLNFVNNFAGLSVELLDELKETTAPAIETLDGDTRAEIDDTIEMLTGNLEKIVEHGQRADGIVKSMLEHSRGVTSERRKVDLNNLVEEALNLTYHGARAQDQNFNISLERDYEKGLAEIDIVPQEVNRVFINLIGNGFYAASKRQRESGEASFRPILKVATRDLGGAVEVRIRDNGIGIPAEIREKLFQPFFTTKPTGEGTGLGLSISYDIVTQQHGGTIEVESEVGGFTEFTVRIPRICPAAAEAAS